ncbi:MAG: ferrous iron transport protein A [Abditibacteriota bacterium]|nr:ferrous iron transport protein A [Abditibacteriota bacterium]
MSDTQKTAHLADLKPGKSYKVLKIVGETNIKRRIIEMGLNPGTEVEIIRKAPLGDPIEVKTRGFLVSLRYNEAHNIIVEKE